MYCSATVNKTPIYILGLFKGQSAAIMLHNIHVKNIMVWYFSVRRF